MSDKLDSTDPAAIVRATNAATRRWAGGGADDETLRQVLDLRARIELQWLFELDKMVIERLGSGRNETALVWLDSIAQLPMRTVTAALTDPIATLWVRQTEAAIASSPAAEAKHLLGGFAPLAAAAFALAGANAPPIIANLPARFSLPILGVEIIRNAAGPIDLEVSEGRIRLSGEQLIITPENEIVAADPATLAAVTVPVAEGYGVRVESTEPSLREAFAWVSPGEFESQAWVQRLGESAALLAAVYPGMLAEMRRNLKVVVPTSSGPTSQHSTGSNRHAWGAVNTTLIDEPFFTDGLIHEHRHDLLNTISIVSPVFANDDVAADERLYSPWRPEPRHTIGVFHAVFVFLEVCEFYLRILAERPAAVEGALGATLDELGLQTVRLLLGVEEVESAGGLTPFGRELLEALKERARILRQAAAALGTFRSGQVAASLRDHHATWRRSWGREAITNVEAGIARWAA